MINQRHLSRFTNKKVNQQHKAEFFLLIRAPLLFGTGWWPWWVGSEGKLMIADGSWWRPCQRGSDATADKSSSKHLRPLSTKNSSMKSINGKTAHQSTIGRNFIEFKSPVDLIFDLIEFEIWKVWIWRHFFFWMEKLETFVKLEAGDEYFLPGGENWIVSDCFFLVEKESFIFCSEAAGQSRSLRFSNFWWNCNVWGCRAESVLKC